ncbi:unnamed protein product [Penicillium crustosum]
MQTVDVGYRASWISPLRPVTISGISQLHQTLVSFFKGTHTSKRHNDSHLSLVGSAGWVGLKYSGYATARNLVTSSRYKFSAPGAQVLIRVLTKHCVYLSPRQACKLGSQEQVLCAIEQESAMRLVEGIVHGAV